MIVDIQPEVSAFVAPVAAAFDQVSIVSRLDALDRALVDAEARLRASSDPGSTVAAVRTMYRRFGVDPTKLRPSSEALARRVKRGEALPRVNAAVDIGNWCSMESQLPFGLYDLRRVEGTRIVVRLGTDGEQYPGIRKDLIHIAGRLTLADDKGPFGNPSADSARTLVDLATTSLLVVVFSPRGCELAGRQALKLTEDRILRYCGGTVTWRSIELGEETALK